jgi:hypothetical protein
MLIISNVSFLVSQTAYIEPGLHIHTLHTNETEKANYTFRQPPLS